MSRPMSDRVIGWRIAAAWTGGVGLGVLIGLGLTAVIFDWWIGVPIGVAVGVLLALSMMQWARGVGSAAPEADSRRVIDSERDAEGPGVFGVNVWGGGAYRAGETAREMDRGSS